MLSFDIETTGVNSHDVVTCACAYDPDRGVEATYVFCQFDRSDPSKSAAMREEFMGLLDDADRLCAFNGVRFDLPFMARCWCIPAERVGKWMRKLFDPFELCKISMDRTFPLSKLLHRNGLEGKTGSGLDAIRMAAEGNFEDLGTYCLQDTRVTHRVCSLPEILLPEPHAFLCISLDSGPSPLRFLV